MRWFVFIFLTIYIISISLLIIRWYDDHTLSIPDIPKLHKISEFVDPQRDHQKVVTVLLGGDVMFGRMVMQTAINNKDYSYPFSNIWVFTNDADIFFVNLENPIINNCPLTDTSMIFCSRPEMLEGLVKAGINIVTLANNHTRNYGLKGISETEKYLHEKKILITGLNNLAIQPFDHISFGFLGFDFTLKAPNDADLRLIKDADPKVDFLVVGVHWGQEYQAKANSNQKKWARSLIENGADIIVGHHPHWVQDFECISYSHSERSEESLSYNNLTMEQSNPPSSRPGGTTEGQGNELAVIATPSLSRGKQSLCDGISGKPVYYSLGNLVFDQMWSEETKKGMLVKLEITKDGIVKEERFSTYIKNVGQPEIVSGDK